MAEALAGIRVLEVGTAIQGPAAGGYLAQMGAEVIKLLPAEGDAGRFHRGVNNYLPDGAWGGQFITANRGKRSVALDAHSPHCRGAIRRLADRADVLLELGFDWDEIVVMNEETRQALRRKVAASGAKPPR